MVTMNIGQLPFFSTLAKDYLTRFSNSPAKKFFPRPPSSEGLSNFLDPLASTFDTLKRDTIAALIEQQASELGLQVDPVQLEKLRSGNALAVVTGQQVTLFGGPLYTIFKTATAIALAERLSQEYPSHNFVPIFWLETEDHDIAEASSATVFNRTNDIQHIRYTPEGFEAATIDQNWKKQVGPYPLDAAEIERAIAQLAESLQPTEFTERILSQIRESYRPGRTFAQAFAHWMYSLFEGQGLLVLDANNATAKSLAKDLFVRELETSPKLSEKVVLQTVKLEEHYHAQVKPRAINMFYVEDGERFAIMEKEKSGEAERSYFLKGTRRTFTHTELRAEIEQHPERFSPNVLMRPLYQDTILPTAAYIGGPGEIAYFAQFQSAYEWAGIPMPLIYPRVTATLIEDKYQKSLDKNGVTAAELLAGGNLVVEQLLNNLADEKLAQLFEELEKEIDERLESVRGTVVDVDRSLDQSLTTLKGKVLSPIRDFGGKVQAADKRRHQTVRDQLSKALTALLPDGELQERVISPLYFLNKYGPQVMDGLMASIRANIPAISEHHLLSVTELLSNEETAEISTGSENVRTSEQPEPFISATTA
jgi:bacillithiol synthase